MKGRLWLLAWISTTFAIETRRLKINLNEEVLIGSEIANLKTELNFGKDRVFSLQTPSDIFQLRLFHSKIFKYALIGPRESQSENGNPKSINYQF